jgi:hypothetical protein
MNNKRRRLNSPEELTDYIKYENNCITYYRGYKNDPKSFRIHREERDSDGLTLPSKIKYDPYIGGDVIKYWYRNGLLHRDEWEGPAVLGPNRVWYNQGMVHRVDGPAIIYEGDFMQVWYLFNRVHRENGPAVLSASFRDYYLFGRKLNERVYKGVSRLINSKQIAVRKKYIDNIHTKLKNKLCTDIRTTIIDYILG